MSAKLTMRNSASIVARTQSPKRSGSLSFETRTTPAGIKKAGQRGRSERKGETYFFAYVEPVSEARTKLTAFFTNLLCGAGVLCQELINHLLELALRPGADQLLHHLPFFEEKDRGNTHDLIASGNLWVFIGVELSDLDLSGIFVGQLINNRSYHLTGSAPDGPKIDHH